MPEGLSAPEVGKEIAKHRQHAADSNEGGDHDRWLSIVEAVLLSLVAVLIGGRVVLAVLRDLLADLGR